MSLVLIPNQSKYYTDGIDIYSIKSRKYLGDYFWKHTGWRLTYKYEWIFYIKKEYRGDSNMKHFFYKHDLKKYINNK